MKGDIHDDKRKHSGRDCYESLRLLDLTNMRGNGKNMPLFVFDSLEKPSDLDSLLNEPGKFAWKKSSEISEILTDLELDSVPIYH